MPAPCLFRHQHFIVLSALPFCPNCCWPRLRVQQWAAVLVGIDQESHLSVVRVNNEKRINKLERYRSGYRCNHDLTVTSRYACPVKVEYLSHDRLSAVTRQNYRTLCTW